MPLAISIFPIWCVLTNPMYSTKMDMFIGDIFIITSAIIISTMDIVGVLGTGVPRLACLRLAAWLKGGPSTAHLHQHKPKTLTRGQASRGGRCGASLGTTSSGWLTRRRRDQGGVPREVPVMQAMTTQGARRVPPAQRPPFLFGAKGASAAAECRGIWRRLPFQCNETKTRRTTRWRSLWSPRRQHHQSFA